MGNNKQNKGKNKIQGQSSGVDNLYVIKEIVGEKTTIRESRQMDLDPFASMYGGDIIEPPYDPELLIRLAENSDILQQCVDAYKTNIPGFGFQIHYDTDYDKEDEGKKAALDDTFTRYEQFFQYCNLDDSFTSMMKKVVEDKEKIGWGCLEVIENGKGEPAGFEHVPAHKIRLCKKDKVATEVHMTIYREDVPTGYIIHKRFRRFVQIVNDQKVYFKEFGDPRQLDCNTGKFGDDVLPEDRASAIIFFENYCSYTEYGLPRYLGQLLNIQGNRKAEELNYRYFQQGRHIPMAIVVENGELTKESIAMLERTKGDMAQHKTLIIQAKGMAGELVVGQEDKRTPVKVHFEPLVHVLEKDGLFQEYCYNNRAKIRSAFRLHPIYTGESQDYNRATADTARQITEEQVFQPEREELAYKLNNLLKPALGINAVSMEFKAPTITDKTEISSALVPFIDAGAATPNMLIDALGDLLGKQFEPFEGEWADVPFIIWQGKQGISPLGAQLPITGVEKSSEYEAITSSLRDLKSEIRKGWLDDEQATA